MARGRERNSLIDQKDMSIFSEKLSMSDNEEVKEATIDLDNLPKKSENTETKQSRAVLPRLSLTPVRETIVRTYVVRQDVADALDDLVTDPDTGRKITGTKGLISKIANNALIKELVALEILEDSMLDTLEDY